MSQFITSIDHNNSTRNILQAHVRYTYIIFYLNLYKVYLFIFELYYTISNIHVTIYYCTLIIIIPCTLIILPLHPYLLFINKLIVKYVPLKIFFKPMWGIHILFSILNYLLYINSTYLYLKSLWDMFNSIYHSSPCEVYPNSVSVPQLSVRILLCFILIII